MTIATSLLYNYIAGYGRQLITQLSIAIAICTYSNIVITYVVITVFRVIQYTRCSLILRWVTEVIDSTIFYYLESINKLVIICHVVDLLHPCPYCILLCNEKYCFQFNYKAMQLTAITIVYYLCMPTLFNVMWLIIL